MPWIKSPEDKTIPVEIAAAAMEQFKEYKKGESYVNFTAPKATITYQEGFAGTRKYVNIAISHNGTRYNLRSINPEDHELVQHYLNKHVLVRGKYANKQTVDPAVTEARVKALSDRFNTSVTDGCFMHGGFVVSDADTGKFLGMANSGYSGTPGITEVAYLFRPDAWSHKPENLTEEYDIPDAERLDKEYSGAATAVICSLVQYTRFLKEQDINKNIKDQEVTAIRATSMVDNEGSWKALAKAGFEPYAVDTKDEWGPEIRYQLELKL